MAKTVDELNLKPVRTHPEDIIKGFTDLGYNDEEIDNQFDFHKKDLGDGNAPGLNDRGQPITDDQVYEYMRSHLKDKTILPNVNESISHFEKRLGGRMPTEEEYQNWIKPKIANRVKEYRDQKMEEKLALNELKDEFGYEDLIKEAWYGKPKRSDVQVWRDRAKKYVSDVGKMWPGAKALLDYNDDNIQELIDLFGFDRRGEW